MQELQQIKNALSKSRSDFDNWILANEDLLSNFFYGSTGREFVAMEFDKFFFSDIQSTFIYKEYHVEKNLTDAFAKFLSFLGIAAERMAESGNISLAKTIVIDLPESPIKLRLRALNEFAQVENVKTDFIEKLPSVLDYLDRSRILYESGSVRPLVDVLVFYYDRAKKALNSRGYTVILTRVEELFLDKGLILKYPFLDHQILTDLINGRNPFELYVEIVAKKCLMPSLTIKKLFNRFNSDYFSHPNVFHSDDNLWGHSKKYILDNVLIRGRGDFSKPSGDITAEDKVMLYCFFNLKKHFFTSYAVFQNVINSLKEFFKSPDYKPVVIDLGCGPMTSGLALADLIFTTRGTAITMSYVGIDIAIPMMKKAKDFMSLPIFSTETTFDFFESWNELSAKRLNGIAGTNNPIIFNASYLFASDTLDEQDLAHYVSNVAKSYKNVYFVFQNPNREDRNIKYIQFKKIVKHKVELQQIENVRYKAANYEKSEDVEYEILKILN